MAHTLLTVIDVFTVRGRGTIAVFDIPFGVEVYIDDELKERTGDRTLRIRGIEMIQKLISLPEPKDTGLLVSDEFKLERGDQVEHLPSILPKDMRAVIDGWKDYMAAIDVSRSSVHPKVAKLEEMAREIYKRRLERLIKRL